MPRRVLRREVAAECDRARPRSPNLANDLGSLRLVDIDDRYGGTFTRQLVRRCRTNPAGTSGNYRDLSGKSGHRVLTSPILFGDAKES